MLNLRAFKRYRVIITKKGQYNFQILRFSHASFFVQLKK